MVQHQKKLNTLTTLAALCGQVAPW